MSDVAQLKPIELEPRLGNAAMNELPLLLGQIDGQELTVSSQVGAVRLDQLRMHVTHSVYCACVNSCEGDSASP
jgi:hypothetical protein